MVVAGDGARPVHPRPRILSVGRRTRTVPPSLRRALEARDRGCRFPGCGLRFTDAHHVKHWADGGETSLRNLVLLCHRHHRAVHEGGVTVCIDKKEQVVFFTPNGRAISDAPRRMSGPSYRGNFDEATDRPYRERAETPPGAAFVGRGATDSGSARSYRGNAGSVAGPFDEGLPGAQPRVRLAPLTLRPSGYDGSARWKRDSDVPWATEARVIDALDNGG
jgi:hypothetical protein